jgi:hypothetical protein
MDDLTPAQREVCRRLGVEPFPSPADLKVGIAANVREDVWPINGLRHQPEGDTTGWYLWAGEDLSNAPEFFKPLHVVHLIER